MRWLTAAISRHNIRVSGSSRVRLSRSVVLLGLMASGKTTVGRLVAEKLQVDFLDNDEQLLKITGLKAGAIAQRDGKAILHNWERTILLQAVQGRPSVITAAASVTDWPDLSEVLMNTYRIWLKATPQILLQRAATSSHRPDFANQLHSIEQLAQKREEALSSVANFTVDTGKLTPAESSDAICAWLTQQEIQG